jgi:shikimate dehydrogenase
MVNMNTSLLAGQTFGMVSDRCRVHLFCCIAELSSLKVIALITIPKRQRRHHRQPEPQRFQGLPVFLHFKKGAFMKIDGTTKIYGIMGKPVAHSLSPAMHNAAFQKLELNNVYLAFEVADVANAMKGFRALGICGVSVTIPHKQAVIPHLDAIDPVAEKIGAVNTLLLDGPQITGYNTDWMGANQAMKGPVRLHNSTVLLLGAGGAARAIGFGLKEQGAEVLLANRTLPTGEALAKDLNCPFYPLADLTKVTADVLINATSVGMEPNADATPVPRSLLANVPVVMDIVYAPLETRLLSEAKQMGCKAIDGTQMLLLQGVAQFELWTGKKAPVDVMREKLMSHLQHSA